MNRKLIEVPDNSLQRSHVPDEKVSWTVPWNEYKPIEYYDPKIAKASEPEIEYGHLFVAERLNRLIASARKMNGKVL